MTANLFQCSVRGDFLASCFSKLSVFTESLKYASNACCLTGVWYIAPSLARLVSVAEQASVALLK